MLVEHPIPNSAPTSLFWEGWLLDFVAHVCEDVCLATRALARPGTDREEDIWGAVGVPVHSKDIVRWG